jgi:hypothetical protein
LYDLSTFLPKKPGDVELKVIKEMFEASVDGQPYDTERWGQYFRPAGVQAPGGASHTDEDTPAPAAKPAVKAAPAPADGFDEDDTPAATTPVAKPAESGKNAQDILAMIRSRQAK